MSFYPIPPSSFWTSKVGDSHPCSVVRPLAGTEIGDGILARTIWGEME